MPDIRSKAEGPEKAVGAGLLGRAEKAVGSSGSFSNIRANSSSAFSWRRFSSATLRADF